MRVFAVVLLLSMAACGGGSPVTPSTMPTPPPRTIAMGSAMPTSGTTFALGTCGFGLCTDALTFLFHVTFDADIAEPVFRVHLKQEDGTECLSSYRSALTHLKAGEAFSYDGRYLMLSTTPPASPGVGEQNCLPPFTTTQITVELRDTSIAAPVLLAQTFDVTYHWAL